MKVKRSLSCSALHKAKHNVKVWNHKQSLLKKKECTTENTHNGLMDCLNTKQHHRRNKKDKDDLMCQTTPNVKPKRSHSVPSSLEENLSHQKVRSCINQSGGSKVKGLSDEMDMTGSSKVVDKVLWQIADGNFPNEQSSKTVTDNSMFDKSEEDQTTGTPSSEGNRHFIAQTSMCNNQERNNKKTIECKSEKAEQNKENAELHTNDVTDGYEEELSEKPLARHTCTIRKGKKKHMTTRTDSYRTPTRETNNSELIDSGIHTSDCVNVDPKMETPENSTLNTEKGHSLQPSEANICSIRVEVTLEHNKDMTNDTGKGPYLALPRPLSIDSSYMSSESVRSIEDIPVQEGDLLLPNSTGGRTNNTVSLLHTQLKKWSFDSSLSEDFCMSPCLSSTPDDNHVDEVCGKPSTESNHRELTEEALTPTICDPSKNFSDQHCCSNMKCKPCDWTQADYREVVDCLFASEIADNIVHIGIEHEEKKVYINVESGTLVETKDFLKKTYQMMYCCNIFRVMDGASAEFAGKWAADPNKKQDEKRIGNSYSHIKSGINIAYPVATKIKRVSKCDWEYAEGVDKNSVDWQQGTIGAVCKDNKTGQLHVLTAGHLFTKEVGFHTGTAHSNCLLTNQRKYISDTYVSYIGRAKGKHGVDAAAVPLLEHIRSDDCIKPYFGGPGDHPEANTTEDVKLSVYKGLSKDLVGKPVQKRGAVTGYKRGTIIKSEGAYVRVKMGNQVTVIGDDCIIIGSDETCFAMAGDSGALVVSDLVSGNEKYAHGIFFYILDGCRQYISKATGRPYSKVYVCVRLDKSLETLNEAAGLSLDLYTPNDKNTKSSLKTVIKPQSCETKGIINTLRSKLRYSPSVNSDFHLRKFRITPSRRYFSLPAQLAGYMSQDQTKYSYYNHCGLMAKSLSALDNTLTV